MLTTSIKVKNIYLNRTKEMVLTYGAEEELIVEGYTDVGFHKDPDNSKAQ